MTWLIDNWHWVLTACAFVLFAVSTVTCIAWDEMDGRRSRYVSPARPMPWEKKAERRDQNG